jgi:hypothetical protein
MTKRRLLLTSSGRVEEHAVCLLKLHQLSLEGMTKMHMLSLLLSNQIPEQMSQHYAPDNRATLLLPLLSLNKVFSHGVSIHVELKASRHRTL